MLHFYLDLCGNRCYNAFTMKGVAVVDERIKYLRKCLNLTQEEFAAKLGVKRGAIANYEIGRNVPVDSVVALICKVFNVNEVWLRTGEGDPFAPAPRSKLDDLAEAHGLTDAQYILLQKFISLKPEIRQGILDYISDVAAAVAAAPSPAPPLASSEESAEALHAELDRQIAMEKEAEEKSEVS